MATARKEPILWVSRYLGYLNREVTKEVSSELTESLLTDVSLVFHQKGLLGLCSAHLLIHLSRHAKGPSVKVVTKEQFNGRPGRAPICSEKFDHFNQPIGLKGATNGEVLG
jgi:hypothetical protein